MASNLATLEDRRDHARAQVSRTVRLHLPSGIRGGYLLDLSRSGAKLEMSPLPAVGSPALLQWDEFEAFGEIVWVRGETCGVRFDRLLAEEAVDGTAEKPPVKSRPAASLGNIPVGARRGSRLVSRAPNHADDPQTAVDAA